MLVRVHLRARLLGIPLLRIDGDVMLHPEVVPGAVLGVEPSRTLPEIAPHTVARSAIEDGEPLGTDLAEAERLLARPRARAAGRGPR